MLAILGFLFMCGIGFIGFVAFVILDAISTENPNKPRPEMNVRVVQVDRE